MIHSVRKILSPKASVVPPPVLVKMYNWDALTGLI